MGAMILADLGAEVVRIERKLPPGAKPASELFDPAIDILNRNRRVVTLDLKKPEGLAAAAQLIAAADGLIEGYRPGVMERLGLGPDECLAANPRLVYGRMTGWGQTGPLAPPPATTSTTCRCPARCTPSASPAASRWCPQPGGRLRRRRDAAGGRRARRAARARSSGRGQVVDAAMTDGSALLMTMMYTLKAMGQWSQQRGSNLLDGGAHFYDTYRCADGKYVSIGPIEPQFYALFLHKAGITDPDFAQQWDRARWPELKARVAAHLATRPRDEWCELLRVATPAWHPFWTWTKRPNTRTIRPAAPSSRSAASRSRPRRRDSAAAPGPPRPSSVADEAPWPTGASAPPPSTAAHAGGIIKQERRTHGLPEHHRRDPRQGRPHHPQPPQGPQRPQRRPRR
jgi:alpha-methylacyl-CoA racemase